MSEQEQRESDGVEALAMAEESNALGGQDELLLTAEALTEVLKEKLTPDEFIALSSYPNQEVVGRALTFAVIAESAKAKQHYEQEAEEWKQLCAEFSEELTRVYDEIEVVRILPDEQKRLDRPELREKIAIILKPLTKSYVLSYIHNLNQFETEIKRVEDCYLDQLIALIPDIEEPEWAGARHLNLDSELEEAKREERERIFKELEDNNEATYDGMLKIYPSVWQALKEEKEEV